jgi:hypothetical protein
MPGEENNTEERICSTKGSSWNTSNKKKEIKRIDGEERSKGKEHERNKAKKQMKCQFLGLHSGAVKAFVPLDSCERQVGSSLPTFQDICLIVGFQGPKWRGDVVPKYM